MNLFLYDRADLRRLGIKLSDSSLARREAQGYFPKRVKVCEGGRSIAWIASEIDAHLASRSVQEAQA